MTTRFRLAILLFITSVAVAGCGDSKACTAMACSDMVTIEMTLPGGDKASASEVKVDGSTISCGANELTTQDSPACSDGEIMLRGTPDAVAVKITYDDSGKTYSFDDTVNPEYETTYPNGEGCPGECQQARETIELKTDSQ